MKISSSKFGVALGSLVGWLVFAGCSSPHGYGTFELKDGEPNTFQGVGKLDNLSPQERAVYRSDRQYVRSLAAPNVAISLNHADERQHRFVLMRLKLAGKTPESSPALFRAIADLRASQVAKGLKSGTIVTLNTPGWTNQHYLPGVLITSASEVRSISTGSRKDQLVYGFVDSGVWAADGTPLGNVNYSEVYGNMPYTNVESTGNRSLTSLLDYEGDSLLTEDSVEHGYRESYVYAAAKGRLTFNGTVINDPTDALGADGRIHVCMERRWTDCDYDVMGWGQLRMPLKGSFTLSDPSYTSGYRFDEGFINTQYKSGLKQGGSIYITLTNVGGGCDVDPAKNVYFNMRNFWNNAFVENSGKTLRWDLSGTNVAVFDPSCRQYQESVILAMDLSVPWVFGTSTGIQPTYISNKPTIPVPQAPSYIIPYPIKITNSCLAAGTEIALPDGSVRPIEAIASGEQVFSPFASKGSALTVTDVAKGTESVPMVRIEDEKSRTLLMTEMHPLPVPDRGVVLAKHLRVGDTVMTRTGPSKLVRVTREQFNGTVHNLKVGTTDEKKGLGEDQTVVYANGFLVGDGQIQSKYEAADLEARQVARRAKLPMRWHSDYQNSVRRSASL